MDDGRLLAWIDGELSADDAAALDAWIRDDPEAARRARAARARAAAVADALTTLDVTAPVARVRRALDGRAPDVHGRRRPPWSHGRRLAQAAVWVLLLAGAASAAVPGSPVRAWLTRLLPDPAPSPAAAPGTPAVSETVAAAPGAVGAWIAVADADVRIDLEGAPRDTEIRVRLVSGDRAGVRAPAGTSLASGEGWIRARVGSGPVEIELPRSLRSGTLRVDGRTYLTVEGGVLRPAVPVSASAADGIRFVVGGPERETP